MRTQIEITAAEATTILEALRGYRLCYDWLLRRQICDEHTDTALKTLRRIDDLIGFMESKMEGRL